MTIQIFGSSDRWDKAAFNLVAAPNSIAASSDVVLLQLEQTEFDSRNGYVILENDKLVLQIYINRSILSLKENKRRYVSYADNANPHDWYSAKFKILSSDIENLQ